MSTPEEQARVYLILGGAGGIGSEVVQRLTQRGDRVVIASRDEERLKGLADKSGATFHVLDATDSEAVEACARQALETHGRLDGMANLVGSILLKPVHLTRPEEWTETMEKNLGTAFSTARAAGRVMKNGGSVVLMSSAAARIGLPNHEAIAAAKAGVEGLTRAAAATYAHRGLRFNAVAPGLVRTSLSERITRSEAGRKASVALHALGRLGEPGEVAELVTWLLSPESAWVTGQVMGVDGGLSSVRAG